MGKIAPSAYPLAITLLGAIPLLTSTPEILQLHPERFLAGVIAIAVLSRLPFSLLAGRATLVFAPALSLTLLYGLPAGVWSMAAGIVLGYLAARLTARSPVESAPATGPDILQSACQLGMHVLPLWLASRFYPNLAGETVPFGQPEPSEVLLFILVALAAHLLISAPTLFLIPGSHENSRKRRLASLIALELLVLPFAFLGTSTGKVLPALGWLAFAGLPVALAFLLAAGDRSQVRVKRQRAHDSRVSSAEMLERTVTTLTATLDPQEVYIRIAQAAERIIGADRSALYLLDPDRTTAILTHGHGLSDSFRLGNRSYSLGSTSRAGCLKSNDPVLVPDLDVVQKDSFTDSVRREGVRAFADIPLKFQNDQLGFLSVFFSQRQDFPTDRVEIFQRFAAHAAIAVANAQKHAQTDLALKRRAHKLEILESVGRQLSAATHSQNLFERILDFALAFTNAPWGALCTLDTETGTVDIRAARGYVSEEKLFSLSENGISRPGENLQPGVFERLINQTSKLGLSAGAARSSLNVPLIYEEQVIGVLMLESPEQQAFTVNDRTFIKQLATQAAIAVVNASLYTELQRRLRHQGHLHTMSQHLINNLQMDAVIKSIIEGMDRVLEADAIGLYLWDSVEGTHTLKSALTDGRQSAHFFAPRLDRQVPGMTSPPNSGAESGQAEPLAGSPAACTSCKTLAFPLQLREKPLGVVLAHLPASASPDGANLQLLRAMAAQGAMALQNALLYTDATEGRDRLKALLDSVDEGVVMVDAAGEVILVNAGLERLTGLPSKTFQDQRLPSLHQSALDALGVTRAESEALITSLRHQDWQMPLKVTVTQGDVTAEKAFERIIAPVWGEQEGAIGWVIVLRDVSEAYKLNQARELITETLVHDLRSPVGAVSSALVVLDDYLVEGDVSPLARQSVDIARRGTMRVLTLIESLLDLSRMESGHIALDVRAFDLGHLVREQLEDFLPLADAVGVALHHRLGQTPLIVQADQDLTSRVLANLLDNALKFTPEGGTIEVFCEADAHLEKIRLCVQDSGPGIPSEYREAIFDRFAQIPGRRGRKRGTGIGLTFCFLALKTQGESIWVEPAPTTGSIFKFSIPLAAHPDGDGTA